MMERRRKLGDVPAAKRKITLTSDEEERLDRMCAEQDTSLSELLVRSALTERAPMTSAQAKQIGATLMAIQEELGQLGVAVRRGELDPFAPEFMRNLAAIDTRVRQATDALVPVANPGGARG